jgi:FkbM family methyltransferase
MLKKIESLINRSPFYNIIRFNFLSDAIVEWKTRRTKKSIQFFSSFLNPLPTNMLAFDIGANKGTKVNALIRMGFKVIALEPEKKAFSTLQWRFDRNEKITLVNKGVAEAPGELTIHVAEGRSGLNTLHEKWVNTLETKDENRWEKKHAFKKHYRVEVTTIEQLSQEFGLPYFIKIDVEGYENKVIEGIRQCPPVISFETNLPEFRDESIECIQHLTALSSQIRFNYSIHDRIEADQWLTATEIIKLLTDPSIRYMEIIGRVQPLS